MKIVVIRVHLILVKSDSCVDVFSHHTADNYNVTDGIWLTFVPYVMLRQNGNQGLVNQLSMYP